MSPAKTRSYGRLLVENRGERADKINEGKLWITAAERVFPGVFRVLNWPENRRIATCFSGGVGLFTMTAPESFSLNPATAAWGMFSGLPGATFLWGRTSF